MRTPERVPKWKQKQEARRAGWDWVGIHHFPGGHRLVSHPDEVVRLDEANERIAALAARLETAEERLRRMDEAGKEAVERAGSAASHLRDAAKKLRDDHA